MAFAEIDSTQFSSIVADPWFGWAVALALALPAAVIVLGEWAMRLRRRGSPLEGPIRLIRNGAIPSLAVYLFLMNVWQLDTQLPIVRLAATAFYLFSLAAVLGIVNSVVFTTADTESWRSRVPALFLDLSRFILVLIGTSIVFSYVWGKDLSGLLTALGVGSIVIGLALQDTLGNVFAGVSILFERPYVEGDWIRYGEHLGQVVEINWRSTRLETHFGDTIIVPNGEMARSVLMNENNRVKPRYETYDIGFSYAHPPNEVKRVLLGTVAGTEGVLDDPPPQVYVMGYGDSSIDYQIRFAVYDLAGLPAIRDNFVTRIWYAAKRNGLNIPFPIRTVYHYNGPVHDTIESQRDDEIGRTAMRRVLPVDEIQSSTPTGVERFGLGEVIFARGDYVEYLHLIVTGRVELRTQSHLPPIKLAAGEIFGIQSLLHAQPSGYTATAACDTVLVRLSRQSVMDLVATKPGFAFELEQMIENRAATAKA